MVGSDLCRCIAIIKSAIADTLAVLLFLPKLALGTEKAGGDEHGASSPFTPLPCELLMTAVFRGHEG